MRKHPPTEGPFVVIGGSVYKIDKDGKEIPIAHMDRNAENGTTPCERDSNAHLLAAAPDLYQACKSALKYIGDWTGEGTEEDSPLMRNIRDAIALVEEEED